VSAPWPLAPVLLVRTRDEVEASAALGDACVRERTREVEHGAVAEALGACAAERLQLDADEERGTACEYAAVARRAAGLREREAALRNALASAANAREDAARAVSAARTALAAARRARELLEARREAFLRHARAQREERDAAEAPVPHRPSG
jgi:hypothetical protein